MKRINFGTKKPTTISISFELEGTEEELGKLQKALRATLKDAGFPVPKSARSEDIAEDVSMMLVALGEAANGRRPDYGVSGEEMLIERIANPTKAETKALKAELVELAQELNDLEETDEDEDDEDFDGEEEEEEQEEEEVVAPPPRPAKEVKELKAAPKVLPKENPKVKLGNKTK